MNPDQTGETMTDRSTQTFTARWADIELLISFERNWLGGDFVSHLQITSAGRHRTELPITETGYLSHFCSAAVIDDAGGPVAYVLGWLDQAATSPRWKAGEVSRRQMSLF
jgi:hypothetical protein